MTKLIPITDENFDKVIKETQKPVLIEFFANWCGHCKAQNPIVEELADSSEDNYVVGQINIDNNPKKALEYSVTGVPAFLVFKDGKIVEHKSGTQRLLDLKNLLTPYC